ncbi:hypothetical protein V8E53_013006, partial [Lactarius tabidus]
MSTSPLVSPVADVRDSFGAAFVGLLVSTTLLGVTIAQTWVYFWNYRKDSIALKFFVAFVTAMDTVQTILSSYAVYWYLILNYGNVQILNTSMWALNIQLIFIVIVGTAVQSYYTKQVYTLSKSIVLSVLIAVSIVIGFSFGLFYSIKQIVTDEYSSLVSLTWYSCVGLTADAVADLLIAGSMCWSLYRKKIGFARCDSKITTFMVYSVNSGLLTSILGVATIISFAASKSLIWLAIFWVMSKCYVNSLLAMLNSRDYIRSRDQSTGGDSNTTDNSFKLSSIRIEPGAAVTVHRPNTSEFGRSKSDHDHDHDEKPTFEIPKPDANIIIPVQSDGQASEV